ncbi:MAG: hypothetical protein JW829_07180, partial [Pirellulales bacterium]|nr:hypothetical protein [Pirellulales bacterium]
MKITNWKKKLAAALVAAGIWIPSTALALDIPLGDPSFEDYTVSASSGYAYSDTYRPTSAWVDDLYSTFSYVEDDGNSNWLYDAAYDATRRPAPRTGNQAMHGYGHYNAQVVDEV